jgi:hypothetical protein
MMQIIPAMRKLAVEKGEEGNVPVVITMCSIKDEMCTHYAVRATFYFIFVRQCKGVFVDYLVVMVSVFRVEHLKGMRGRYKKMNLETKMLDKQTKLSRLTRFRPLLL